MKLFLKPKTLTNKSLRHIRWVMLFNNSYDFLIRARERDYNLIDDDIYLQLGYVTEFNYKTNDYISISVGRKTEHLINLTK